MNLKERITLLVKLGKYLTEGRAELESIKQKAFEKNKWFTGEFIDLAFRNIVAQYLDETKLNSWIQYYHLDDNINPKKIGVVMAGNIPLVGFHDFLSVFVAGHHQLIKLSEKDDVLLKHIVEKLHQWNPKTGALVEIASRLADCDAYIATGSNNSARYFNYYFGKYPSVIRSNKTSVEVLSGDETLAELSSLADDVYTYFGLGCRNVTKIFVPENYDFVMLLNALKKYDHFSDIAKYKNNYDYNLALLIMNNRFYMKNESLILSENESVFSPVSMLHYSFYKDENALKDQLKNDENIQCIIGRRYLPFGSAQQPGLFDYADGIDTMQFLLGL
jgi:hypothetical protein